MTKIEQLRQQLDDRDYPLTHADILELLNLVELQHKTLGKMPVTDCCVSTCPICEALASFENWNKP